MRTHLGYGQFYGRRATVREIDGLQVALMVADPVREVAVHTHETAHVILHLEGGYRSTAAGAPTRSDEPILIFNPPGTTHRDHYERRSGVYTGRFVSIGIDDRRWCELSELRAGGLDARSSRTPGSMTRAARLLKALGADDLSVESAVIELLSPFVLARPVTPARPPGWLRRATEVLRDRCVERLRLTDVAATCDVHPVYFTRAFRRHVGMSPSAFIRQERLERAAALVACSPLPMARIAAACGYAHQSHMTREFRAKLGCTPVVYRHGRQR